MNFQSTTQSYPKPMAGVRVRQQVRRQKVMDFPGGAMLWKALGKIGALLFVCILSVNVVMNSLAQRNTDALVSAKNIRHELVDSNIQLRAKKAHLLTAEQVRIAAASKLSLTIPGKGKHYFFKR